MLRFLAILVGIIFITSGVMGFIPEFMHEGKLFGIFAINTIKNFIHIGIGLLGIVSGWKSKMAAKIFFITFGLIFLLIAALGFFNIAWELVRYVIVDNFDLWLNAGLAVIFLYIGFQFIRR